MLKILDCRLDAVDANFATQAIFTFIKDRTRAHIITLGTEMVVYAQRDKKFRDIINASALSLCDTAGLLAVARNRGADLRERVTGVELIDRLCARAAQENVAVFFLGGASNVAEEAAKKLRERYPALNVAGTHSGYFLEAENATITENIRASGAQLLFVGLGSPRQEFWITQNLNATGAAAAIGIGGSFDVIAGRTQRAPHTWQRAHLEWLYRLLKEPRRWRRQLALPYFVWLIVLENLSGRAKRVSEGRSETLERK